MVSCSLIVSFAFLSAVLAFLVLIRIAVKLIAKK